MFRRRPVECARRSPAIPQSNRKDTAILAIATIAGSAVAVGMPLISRRDLAAEVQARSGLDAHRDTAGRELLSRNGARRDLL